METIDISDRSRAVNALSDNDLVMACGSGLSPITFANLAKAVRNTMQVGGRNLLLNSNTPKTKAQWYSYSENPVIGKTYAVTACVTPDAGTTRVTLGLNDGNLHNTVYLSNPTAGEQVVMKGVVTITHNCNYFYIHAIGGGATCHWAVVVEGNMPVAAWMPAPEDLRGGGNWLSANYLHNWRERRLAC